MALHLLSNHWPAGFFDGAVARILELQRGDGLIPWFDRGVWDPWNHTESAMGLLVMGRREEAEACYAALARIQEPDGSWWAEYGAAVSLETGRYQGSGHEPKKRDTNFIAYPAVGLWHHYLATGDRAHLERHWPMLKAAIGFVLGLQSEHGEIRWCAPDPDTARDDALVTGNASIYKSLECAIRAGEVLGADVSAWRHARTRLGAALRGRPERFDRTWEKKDYFSMDWYYPVLAGAVREAGARARLTARWGEFVVEGKGCRCVSGQPWVTVAEGCELALALVAAGQPARASEVFSWQHEWRSGDGSYWMGWQLEQNVPWPEERPAWTAAAAILAADAITAATPAARLFRETLGEEPAQDSQRQDRRHRFKQP